MDSVDIAIRFSRGAMGTALELALPVLAAGLVVGLVVSVLQAMTQVHDQTLSFIPKILSVFGVVFLLLPWLLAVLTSYTRGVFERLGEGLLP
jgi:flagellar biosynthetic protein FliQ